jgi:hypothetical protein
MASDAAYIIAVWTLTGMALGLLSTLYGACRKTFRFWPGTGEFLDWLWFVLAAALFVVVAFWTEWGAFRVWSIVFVLVGYLIWAWLAAPLTLFVVSAAAYGQARLVHYLTVPPIAAARLVKRLWPSRKLPPPKE